MVDLTKSVFLKLLEIQKLESEIKMLKREIEALALQGLLELTKEKQDEMVQGHSVGQ